jgi:hypothetical protein
VNWSWGGKRKGRRKKGKVAPVRRECPCSYAGECMRSSLEVKARVR